MASGGSVAEFLEAHSDAEMLPSGKVRCTVSGHEMVARIEVLKQYWDGSKYRNAAARASYDFAQHEPWIVPHKKDPHLLYCTLTRQPLSKMPEPVKNHVNGKRYQQLLKEATEGPSESSKKKGKKRRRADEEDEDEDLGGDSGDGGEEDEGGDAAEFFSEGAFWEREGEESEAGDDSAAVGAEDDEDAFWTRPKIVVASDAGRGAKQRKRAAAGRAGDQIKKERMAADDAAKPKGAGSRKDAAAKPKVREARIKGAPKVKLGSKPVG